MSDTTPIDPVVPQEEQVNIDYTNEDLHKESLLDIAKNTEIPKEEPKKEPIEEEVSFDEAGKKIAEDAAAAVLKAQDERDAKIEADRLAVEEEAKKPKTPEEEYQNIAKEFSDKEGRNPTWEELAVKMEERTLAKFEAKQAEKEKLASDEKERVEKARAEETKRINAFVDDEMDELYSKNKLTPIKDPKNPSDQGIMERKELFRQWKEVNDKRISEGKPEIISATRIYENYYKRPSAQPAGADAPIAGNKNSTVSPSEEQTYTYQDLKKPWTTFWRK